MQRIKPAEAQDHRLLLSIWLASVRATHDFLSEGEIHALLPVVRDAALPNLEVWVLQDENSSAVGFIGLDNASVEALFISPLFFRRGGGKFLIEHAHRLKGPLNVSVNEENPSALAFYLANGFRVASRSEFDGQGRPHPLIHLTEQAVPGKQAAEQDDLDLGRPDAQALQLNARGAADT